MFIDLLFLPALSVGIVKCVDVFLLVRISRQIPGGPIVFGKAEYDILNYKYLEKRLKCFLVKFDII